MSGIAERPGATILHSLGGCHGSMSLQIHLISRPPGNAPVASAPLSAITIGSYLNWSCASYQHRGPNSNSDMPTKIPQNMFTKLQTKFTAAMPAISACSVGQSIETSASLPLIMRTQSTPNSYLTPGHLSGIRELESTYSEGFVFRTSALNTNVLCPAGITLC